MRCVRCGVLLVFVVASSAVVAAAEPTTQPRSSSVSRRDIGERLVNFEKSLAARTLTDEQTRELNRRFDSMTGLYAIGRSAEAARALDAMLAEDDEPPAARILRGLRLRAEPEFPSVGRAFDLIIQPVYAVKDPPIGLRVRLLDGAGREVAAAALLSPPRPSVAAVVPLPAIQLAGPYTLEVSAEGVDPPRRVRLPVLTQAPADIREGLLARLDKLDAKSDAVRICRSRVSLLVQTPDDRISAQFLLDPIDHAAEVAAEVAALEAGKNPYRGRPGEWWCTLDFDPTRIPVRVYAPEKHLGRRLPLLIALHGVRGDENLFFHGYGNGALRHLADQHGFIAVAPLTYPLALDSGLQPRLIERIAALYEIDPDRIYLVGHSLGAVTAAAWAKRSADQLAGVVLFAGINVLRDARALPPTLAYGAGLDAVVPANRIEAEAHKARQAGLPVEYRFLPNHGHTLLVGDKLPEAVRWLLDHKRP